jgi:hypothetical protein
VEHRFASKKRPDAHAVKPSYKLTAWSPRFNAVSPTQLMKSKVRGGDVISDPAIGSIRVSACLDHIDEGSVDPNLKPLERASQRFADV